MMISQIRFHHLIINSVKLNLLKLMISYYNESFSLIYTVQANACGCCTVECGDMISVIMITSQRCGQYKTLQRVSAGTGTYQIR